MTRRPSILRDPDAAERVPFVQLLPNIRLRPIEVYAVYPANSPRDSLARLFVDFLMEQDWTAVDGFTRSGRF